jgi:hypothetical protein
VSAATRTSSDARHRSLLDAVVAAARFERSVRRAPHLRIERGRGRLGAGVALAVTRELRRLA